MIDVQLDVIGTQRGLIDLRPTLIESERSDVDRAAFSVGGAGKVIDTHYSNIAPARANISSPRRPIDPGSAPMDHPPPTVRAPGLLPFGGMDNGDSIPDVRSSPVPRSA